MADVAGMVLPFFGMIFLGAVAARLAGQPLEALGWMNVFIVYVALPALFFLLVARTPIEQLSEWRYIAGVLVSTALMFWLMFAISVVVSRSGIAESTIKGLAASYGNIGYMGPGLALLAFGPEAAVPVALIFCFENIMHFAVAPTMMALSGGDKTPPLRLALGVVRRVVTHPFIIATALGVLAASVQFVPPVPVGRLLDSLAQAAAPCALFAMGVTLALNPIGRVPRELGAIAAIKLVLHPVVCYLVLSLAGNFSAVWVYSAVLLASLPTATNVFVIATQYGVWRQRSSASVLLTTVMSVATVTGLLYLIRSGVLPPDLFP